MKRIIFILLLFLGYSVWATPVKKQVKLVLRNTTVGNLLADATALYLDYGTSVNYIVSEDSRKIFSEAEAVPQVYTFTADGIPCNTTGYGLFSQSLEIRLGIRTDSSTNFILFASQLSNFDSTSLILLEDRLTGTVFDLRQGDYAFQSAPGFSEQRFYLHITYPVALSTVDADCSNTNGSVVVAQDNAVAWTSVDLYNTAGNYLATLPAGGGNQTFTGLLQGDYLVQFTYNNYIAYKPVSIIGNQITAAISAASNTVVAGQPLQFYSTTGNANTYEWDFGDGTIISEIANPTITYYNTGTYTVTLKCTNNYGCTETASMQVSVTQATGITQTTDNNFKIFADHTNIVFDRGDVAAETKFVITNIIGQPVATGSFDAGRYVADLSTQPDGVYIADVQGQGFRYSKKIYVRR